MFDISNSADILDIREIIERIEELRDEREALADDLHDAETDVTLAEHGDGDVSGELIANRDAAAESLALFDADEGAELKSLESFIGEFKGYGGDHEFDGDWYPVTLVRDSYWIEFAQDEAEQLDLIKKDAAWPNNHIDWDAAAAELQQDYTSGDFDGVTYWGRS